MENEGALSANAELLAIFRDELEGRAENLRRGAITLDKEGFAALDLPGLVRDAHTIKGNARVMGFELIATAAELLETAWRSVKTGETPAETLCDPMSKVAGLLAKAVAPTPIITSRLEAEVGILRDTLGVDPPDPEPNIEVVRPPLTPPLTAVPQPLVPALDPPSDNASERLGGLIESLHHAVAGDSTAVETTKLYDLINRITELRLDVEAADEHGSSSMVATLAADIGDLEKRAQDLTSVMFDSISESFPQLVKYLARRTGRDVRFEMSGGDTRVDRQILDHLREPLRHLLVNAVDHGIEQPDQRAAAGKPRTGVVNLAVRTLDGQLQITVSDDGRGINWDGIRALAVQKGLITGSPEEIVQNVVFSPEFSSMPEVNELSGDGQGLHQVADVAEKLNGGVALSSRLGEGTSVVLTLPLSWAIREVVLVEAEGKHWGIPAAAVLAELPLAVADVRPGAHRMELLFQGHQHLPISSFATAVGLPEIEAVNEVIVLSTRSGPVALTVPEIAGRRSVAVKAIGPLLRGAPHVNSVALLGGGEVVAVIDPNRIADRVRIVPEPVGARPRVLVVDDSRGARQLVSATLTSQGFESVVAASAAEALTVLESADFDALVVDFSMPESDGVDLVRSIRESTPLIPVVMVSAVASSSDQTRAWEAGVNAYLDKFDVRKGVLVTTLRSLLNEEPTQGEETT